MGDRRETMRKRSGIEDQILTPPPTPDFLSKNLSGTKSQKDMLTKENWSGAKTAPTAISRTFTPFLRENSFP